MPRLLIDADILAYKTAFSSEVKTNWGDGLWTWHAQEHVAFQKVDDWIANIHKHLGADPSESIYCFTGSTNWRKDIMPEYKGNRADSRTPLVLGPVKDYIKSLYVFEQREPLEADDILSTLLVCNSDCILVSLDKDFKQVPGKKCRDVGQPVTQTSPLEGFLWHMRQTLTGDPTDGYCGCPGVGPVRAEKAIGNLTDPIEIWAKVVKEYDKAGLSEAEALRQARVAKILTTFDPAKRLWVPPGHPDFSLT